MRKAEYGLCFYCDDCFFVTRDEYGEVEQKDASGNFACDGCFDLFSQLEMDCYE